MAVTGSELVKSGGGLSSAQEIDEARRHLPELVERKDSETLDEIAARAEAVRQYQARRGHKALADRASRLKLECEAAIGLIDLQIAPWGPGTSLEPLEIAGRVIETEARGRWRLFGMAEMTGHLAVVLDEFEADADKEVGSSTIYTRLREIGVGWVDPQPLRDAVTRAVAEGVSASELARRAGVNVNTVSDLMRKRRRVVSLPHALRLARAVGVDANVLQPRAQRRNYRPRHPRLRRPRTIRGDWRRAYGYLRKVMEEVDRLDGQSGNDGLWEALHHAEDIIAARSRGRRR